MDQVVVVCFCCTCSVLIEASVLPSVNFGVAVFNGRLIKRKGFSPTPLSHPNEVFCVRFALQAPKQDPSCKTSSMWSSAPFADRPPCIAPLKPSTLRGVCSIRICIHLGYPVYAGTGNAAQMEARIERGVCFLWPMVCPAKWVFILSAESFAFRFFCFSFSSAFLIAFDWIANQSCEWLRHQSTTRTFFLLHTTKGQLPPKLRECSQNGDQVILLVQTCRPMYQQRHIAPRPDRWVD